MKTSKCWRKLLKFVRREERQSSPEETSGKPVLILTGWTLEQIGKTKHSAQVNSKPVEALIIAAVVGSLLGVLLKNDVLTAIGIAGLYTLFILLHLEVIE